MAVAGGGRAAANSASMSATPPAAARRAARRAPARAPRPRPRRAARRAARGDGRAARPARAAPPRTPRRGSGARRRPASFRRAAPRRIAIATPQRASSSLTRRLICRSGESSAAVRPGVSSASRIAMASASASSISSAASMIAMPASGSSPERPPRRVAPEIGRIGGAQRVAEEAGAPLQRRRDDAERPTSAREATMISSRRNSAACGWPAIAAPSSGADQAPGRLVEIEIEIGQHDRAMRRARDPRDQPRGRAIGAGRAGDDHGPLAAPAPSRSSSCSTSSAPRAAASMSACSASQAGHCAIAILRKSSVMRQ